jgi:hypothetical protein
MSHLLNALQKLSLRLNKKSVENFTIIGDFTKQMSEYDQVRTGNYTDPDSDFAKQSKIAIEAALKDGHDLKTIMANLPATDILSFVEKFEKYNSDLTDDQLDSKIRVSEFLVFFTKSFISLQKEEILKTASSTVRIPYTNEQKTLIFELLDSLGMIVDSIHKSSLFEKSRRKYYSVSVENFTDVEQNAMDRIIIDLEACNSVLKSKKCQDCQDCSIWQISTYGLLVLSVISMMIIAYKSL